MRGYGYGVSELPFRTEVPGLGRRELANVVAVSAPVEPGDDRALEAIVVIAHRDTFGLSQGADDNASGTAVLLELARTLGDASLDHTLLLISSDGGSFGALGAQRLASDSRLVERLTATSGAIPVAVIAVDTVGRSGEARLLVDGDRPRSPAGAFLATARVSLGLSRHPGRVESPLRQLFSLAFPLGLTEQAPFLGAGVSAITVTSSPTPARREGQDTLEQLDLAAITRIGQGVQSLVLSLDQATEIARSTDSRLFFDAFAVRGFALRLTLLAALLPALLAAVDYFARCRRNRIPLAPALRSLARRTLVAAWVGVLLLLFSALELFPGGSRPLPPESDLARTWPVATLAVFAGLALLGWLALRPQAAAQPRGDRPQELGGHLATVLATILLSLVVAAANPYALVFVLPSLHSWLWLPHARGLPARLAIVALGLAGPVAVVVGLSERLELGGDTPWYLVALASGGQVSGLLVLAFLAWCAVLAQTVLLALGLYAPDPPGRKRWAGWLSAAARSARASRQRARSRLAPPR